MPKINPMAEIRELPLLLWTPLEWAEEALEDTTALLNDHAHLEKKAASNALELLLRWPEKRIPEPWVQMLSDISKDEVQHLKSVVRLLEARGAELSRHHRNTYAKGLRDLVRYGDSENELLDRLIISALIEARSCERFALLAECCSELRLKKFYRSLFASEKGHYEIFLTLSESFLPKKVVRSRWKDCLEQEAEILAAQSAGARIHSWLH